MFPSGRPGTALLILRLSLSVHLLDGVVLKLDPAWAIFAPWTVALGLCFGFLTPVAAALSIVIGLSTWLTGIGLPHAAQVCAVLDAVALTLLGPGAYSLDARLFGRRRIVLAPHAGASDD